MEIYTTSAHDFLYQTSRRKLNPSEIELVGKSLLRRT